ncbi:MAG: class sortase [Solirubrobacterales bacterium]|nr:class sortase [Solirubrobacterales bacterium]
MLVVIGLGTALDGALAVFWQEPLTAIVAARAQHGLREEWAQREHDWAVRAPSRQALLRPSASVPAAPVIATPGRPRRPPPTARPRAGHAAAKLTIPRIGLRRIVVRGTSSSALRRGPGLYEELAWPGRGRVSAIAGHRTTWGAPFRRLDALRAGDRIVLELPGQVLRYRVQQTRVVDPGDRSVLEPGRGTTLVLTACDPPGSARHRIAVRAVLRQRVGRVVRPG